MTKRRNEFYYFRRHIVFVSLLTEKRCECRFGVCLDIYIPKSISNASVLSVTDTVSSVMETFHSLLLFNLKFLSRIIIIITQVSKCI